MLLNQVQADLRAGKELTEQERYLAGLTRVRYLYVDQEQHDLILEGPAEDRWEVKPEGMVVGATSGQPLLQLEDFAVAWRNANDGSPPPSVSLEHRPESVQRIQEIIRATQPPTTKAARDELTKKLEDAWGLQDAVTGGVPQKTRFNKVMVDADWEMKRISLGHSETGVEKFPTYVDLEFDDLRRRVKADTVNTRRPSLGSRFWFVPAYAEFVRTENSDAVAIPDDPVKLLTESHFRNLAQGKQIAEEPTPAAKQFVEAFTKNYAAIAEHNPLYADLRNLFDWVAVSRLIKLLDVPRRIEWDFTSLRQSVPVRDLPVPAAMPGVIAVRHENVKTNQGTAAVTFPASGGVSIDVSRSIRLERSGVNESLARRLLAAVSARPHGPGAWWQ